MKNIFKKIILWVYIKLHYAIVMLSIALRNTEISILKADPNNLTERDKKITRKLHHNQLLEKFYAGKRDEKYMKDYYKLLKKADKFMKEATSHKMAVAADKYSMSLGRKDQYGRSYDHIGFFYDGHKHVGKTMGEVLKIEMEERRTKDDDYELLYIYNNKPIEIGLSKIDDVVDTEYKLKDLQEKSKIYEFPMRILRNNDNIPNKIEQLAEFLHIKKIGFDHRQIEFFIPKKYGLHKFDEDTDIFKEIVDINYVYINNDYGDLIGFNVKEYMKRLDYDKEYEVLKFHAIEMETTNNY